MKPLPPNRFELYEFKRTKAAADCHIQIEGMRYSVPYILIGRTLDARLTLRVLASDYYSHK